MLLLTFGNPLIRMNQNVFWRNNSECLFWNSLRKESFWVIHKHGVSATPLIPNIVLSGLLFPCVSCTSLPSEVWHLISWKRSMGSPLAWHFPCDLASDSSIYFLAGCLEIDWVVGVHLRVLRKSKICSILWDQPLMGPCPLHITALRLSFSQ